MTDASLPPDPRIARQRAVALYLRIGILLAFVLGVIALVLPDDLGRNFGIAMTVVLIAAPLGRVGWLLVRWLRRGDLRFAAAAFVLLAVTASGLLFAH
jgi:hypothetical protein